MSSHVRLALLLAVLALASSACKRKMDDVIPNSTPSATATVAAASASATAAAPDDSAEPLAPLSSTKIVAPAPVAAAPKSDAGAAAAAKPVPQECGAAVLMKKLGKVSEAETLRIKCVDKGGKDPFPK